MDLLEARTLSTHHRMKQQIIISLYILLFIFESVCAVCYFPIEFQGTFLTQTQATPAYGGHTVTYSEITVEVDSIPPWGRCHRRRGNKVILKDTTGGGDCIRCFHITLKSLNVIQIHTEGLARCYTNEDAARATCPDERAVLERRFTEILLFRKHDPATMLTVEDLFCPISGRFRFTYTANHGEFHCDQPYSELSNCPNGNGLNVQFRQCSFPEMSISFLCLGDWPGPNGDRYIALMDLRDEPEARPKYRCGLYRKDSNSGRVYVSLAADSSCTEQLISATSGYESLILSPLPERSLPAEVESARCRFPEWSQGQWEHLTMDGNTFHFRDHTLFQSLTGRCILRENTTPNERFLIYTVTQCGEETYNCVWLQRRTSNVMEFQLGMEASSKYTDSLCQDQNFPASAWITEARLHKLQMSPCPIMGDYTGEVPGTTGLCAKVSSDCNNPDIMFYTVSNCEERGHIYEEREYRCLGSWEEDGVVFTYTQRRDMDGFQCFSGTVLRNGEEAFIKEAGDSCIRGEDPLIYGMKIVKQSSCMQIAPATFVPVRPPWRPVTAVPPASHPSGSPPMRPTPRDPYWYNAGTETPTTRPWKPITGRPRPEPPSASYRHTSSCLLIILLFILAYRSVF